ncbi:MAG: tetratricopeptide repeat protein [Myxococcales bacterium]|nr:tetratricopeptide repeat protein [Myxococcales bacterium]
MALFGLRWQARRHPDAGNNWLALATALHKQGDLKEAKQAALSAATFKIDTKVGLEVARLMESQGELKAALGLFAAVTRSDPENPDAHGFYGMFLLRCGQVEAAVRALRTAVQLQPSSVIGHLILADSLVQTGALTLALQHVQTAIGLDPDSVESFVRLGRILDQLERFTDALDAYRSAHALDPLDPAGTIALGSALCRGARAREAVALLEVLVDRDPDSIEALRACAQAKVDAGDLHGAVVLLRDVTRLSPESGEAFVELAGLEARSGELEAAITSCRRAVTLTPGSGLAFLQLGEALMELGRGAEAKESLEAAQQLCAPGDERRERAAQALRTLRRPTPPLGGISLFELPTFGEQDGLESLSAEGTIHDFEIEEVTEGEARTRPRETEPPPQVRVVRMRPPELRGGVPTSPVPPAQALKPTTAVPPQATPVLDSDGGGPAFTGNLSLFSLPNLLEFLRVNRSTGTLSLVGRRGEGEVRLNSGALTFCWASRASSLVDVLRQTEDIPKLELDTDAVIDLLISQDLVSRRVLRAAMISQIHEAMIELIEWEVGTFSFSASLALGGPVGVELPTEMVVMEALRRVDERRRV